MGRLQNLFQRPDTAVYDALEDAQDDNDSAYREDGNEDDGVEEEGDIQPDDAHDLAPPFSPALSTPSSSYKASPCSGPGK